MRLEVKGHSGCSIEVLRENNKLYIVKSTHDKKYFKRLRLQIQKQKDAYKDYNKVNHIRIPKIIKEIDTDDSVSMQMDYIYSKNFIDFFETATLSDIQNLKKFLRNFIDNEVNDSVDTSVSKDIVINKWKSVKSNIENNKNICENSKVKKLTTECDKIFMNIKNDFTMPCGKCHGDLTFSNILFNGNDFYLIDFLDSFIESPLLDMVKIRQDTAYSWSTLMYNKNYDALRLKIIYENIDTELNEFFNKYDCYKKYYKIFQLMNFVRILQYAHEDKVITYLINTINSILYDEQ